MSISLIRTAFVFTTFCLLSCSKGSNNNNCWECTVSTVQYRNGVKFQDVTEKGTQCDKTESDIRSYEAKETGDKQYNDANGDVIRRVYTTKCVKK